MKSLHVGAVVLLAAAVQAHAALPSNGIVPSYGYSEVTVPGQASVSGLAVAGTLEKRGLGTLTLTNLLSVPGTVLVQQGTVTLAETAPSVLPASLQSGLAFWVDANTNYVLNGSGTVEKWLDVREAATNEPYAYMRAEHDFTYYPDGPRSRRPSRVQGVSDVNGNAMIDFGAFGAIDATAAWLPWRNADGTRGVLSNIRAVFAVAAFPDGNGFFVEDWDYVADSPGLTNFYGSGDFWLGAETQFKRYFYLFGSYAEAYKGATYVNGVRVNGGDRVPDALGQVIEVMAANTLTAANFFNGRNIDGYEGTFPHIGGGRLGEVLVYTNVLTEAERLGIESYLQRKWKGLGQVGVQRVEAGATLVTEAQAGSTLKLGGVEGAGLWRKTGEGSAGLSSDTALFNGAIRLEAGALEDKGIVRRPNRLFDVPEQGLVVQADTDRWAVVASALGALTKTGAGELTVTGFPTSVSQVNVNGGTLRLTQALRDPEQVQPVTIYNNSFEIFTDHNFHGQWASAAPDLWGFEPAGSGWTYTGNPTESSSPSAAGIYMPNGHTAIWCATQPASDGEWVAIIKQGGGMATTFNVSTAGRYRLVFYAAGRNNCGPHLLDILIDGQLISKTRTTHPQFIRYAYKLPDLTAGTHTLAFQGIDENSDRTSLLDDIRIERIGDSRVEATVPNGTFERMDPLTESDPASPVVATGNDPGTYSFTYAVANGDWTFVPFGSGISDGFSPWLSQQITGEGARSAYIRMQGTLSTTVVFPTNGTYTLSFLTAARPPWKGWMYSPHDFRVKMSGLIVLTRNNVNTSFERVEVTLPTITNAPTAAELVFEGINSMGDDRASLFDDVQVVRSDDNQVHDCGFEVPTGTLPKSDDAWGSGVTCTAWTFDLGTIDPYRNMSGITRNGPSWPLPTAPEGTAAAFLQMASKISQPITFNEEGYYTLSFMVAGRTRPMPQYGHQDFRILFNGEQVGAVQTVDETWRRCTFRLPYVKAGVAYTLMFQANNSMYNQLDLGEDHTSFIDDVRIAKQTAVSAAGTPGVYKNEVVRLDAGSKLALDFPGQVVFKEIWYDGRLYSGTLSAENTPFVTGAGSAYVSPKGTIIGIQ